MTFDVAAEAYNRFMGRYSELLAVPFADQAELDQGVRTLDVGCGPGALTAELVRRLGATAVAAVDPSGSFVSALRARLPDVEVHAAAAEQLPFDDDSFDVSLAQLVVHFMTDPVAGLGEMARVTRAGGLVSACVWDHSGDSGPLSLFWSAVHDLDPAAGDEAMLPGTRPGHLEELFAAAGLADTELSTLTVHVGYSSFDDWWEPYTLGVGPAGAFVARLDDDRREQLRDRCAQRLPSAPFEVAASAWSVRARV